eukprot:CAMPEP_0197301410 /NCGR_PEP_ID=MMETSP0890-20130614/50377_1 /TAXON_ID=44058 ORGANISM="Aureoumbra lagunensis, Strain CCMP1510" /NCGR_SAMPLE_ID=MMETSP0890 /ASSEMBLY_ACC=CAM_ASM_000533 /LENGTH=46 /DNA_ID= /DNA_START= /DNA_END= /DNA_ORIENTATION=
MTLALGQAIAKGRPGKPPPQPKSKTLTPSDHLSINPGILNNASDGK